MIRLLLAIAAAVLAFGGDPAPGGEASAAAAKQTKLTLEQSPYGRVLFADGYALYVFTRDDGSRSRCYGECAAAWPPLRPSGEVVAADGVKSRLLGTTTRRDGSEQVTYAGRPLYFYVNDPRGEVLCQDVVEYGGTWYAVRRSGRAA